MLRCKFKSSACMQLNSSTAMIYAPSQMQPTSNRKLSSASLPGDGKVRQQFVPQAYLERCSANDIPSASLVYNSTIQVNPFVQGLEWESKKVSRDSEFTSVHTHSQQTPARSSVHGCLYLQRLPFQHLVAA